MNSTQTPRSSAKQVSDLEYSSLREEIAQSDKIKGNILILTVGAVGTMLAYSATLPAENPLMRASVILAGNVVVWLSGIMLANYTRKIIRIAAYLTVFIDPVAERMHWESRLNMISSVREREPDAYLPSETPEVRVILALHVACFAYLVLNNIRPDGTTTFEQFADTYFFFPAVNVLFFAYAIWHAMRTAKYQRRNGREHDAFKLAWRAVLDEEQRVRLQARPEGNLAEPPRGAP